MKKIALRANSNNIKASIHLPASKSISNRVLIIRALSNDWFKIENLADSDDTKVLDSILKSNHSSFDVGDAGTAMRFLTAFLSKIVGEWTLSGSERMHERPVGKLVDALNSIGANITYLENDGYPPLKIIGSNLTGKKIEIDGDISSQFITALLLIAPTLLNGLEIIIRNKLISRPYVEMTLNIMKYFGVYADFSDNRIFVEHQNYEPGNIKIESDWSAASYWYEIAALADTADIKLSGLNKNSFQGDAVLSEIYNAFGIETSFHEKGIRLTKTKNTDRQIELNLESYPDLSLALVVTAAFLKIPFRFSGLQSLIIKESDRIAALQNELKKFRIELVEVSNGVIQIHEYPKILNKEKVEIETYNDHRIAMAFAPVALLHDKIQIKDPEVVSKSYPGFWDDLKLAGIETA